MMDMTEVKSPIELELENQKLRLAQKIAKWNGAKSILDPLCNALLMVGVEASFDGQINVNFAGDKDQLAKVMRIVRTGGWVFTNTHRPKKGGTSWTSYAGHPHTTVQMWFYFTSTVCKRVKVGTKMVEQDIYEVECGDISDGQETPSLGDAIPRIQDTAEEQPQLQSEF